MEQVLDTTARSIPKVSNRTSISTRTRAFSITLLKARSPPGLNRMIPLCNIQHTNKQSITGAQPKLRKLSHCLALLIFSLIRACIELKCTVPSKKFPEDWHVVGARGSFFNLLFSPRETQAQDSGNCDELASRDCTCAHVHSYILHAPHPLLLLLGFASGGMH